MTMKSNHKVDTINIWCTQNVTIAVENVNYDCVFVAIWSVDLDV